MKITKRELRLLTITIAVIALGINYVLVIPLLRSWRDTVARLGTQQRQLTVMEETIKRAPEWQKQYEELRQGLGQKTERFQQMSDVDRIILEVAGATGVQLVSRTPMTVEDKGVYRVLPVRCTVDATTDSLVRFLFALQTGAGFVSVEQLQVSPRAENPSILHCDIQVRALAGKLGGASS
jgi:hypothetical protein